MRKLNPILLLLLSIILFACPKNDPSPDIDGREDFKGAYIIFGKDMPRGVECGKPFEIKGISFIMEKRSNDTEKCYYSNIEHLVRMGYGSEFIVDLSKYKNIKSIEIGVTHTNPFDLTGKNKGSMAILYDLNDKIIAEKLVGRITGGNYSPSPTEFKEDLNNVKKIVIQGWAEVTDITSLTIY